MFSLRPAKQHASLLSSVRAFSSTPASRLARTTIIGRLATAPEEVTTSSGRSMVRYTLATDSGWGETKHTNFFRVASFIEGGSKNYILAAPKGALVHVEADTRLRVNEDSEGNKTQRLDLLQRSFDILSRPRSSYESPASEKPSSE